MYYKRTVQFGNFNIKAKENIFCFKFLVLRLLKNTSQLDKYVNDKFNYKRIKLV
jgi:hypothetical protein